MSNVIDLNTKRLKLIQDELIESSKEGKITVKNLNYHLQLLNNCYLKIFTHLSGGYSSFSVTTAKKIRKEIQDKFTEVLEAIDTQISTQMDLMD